MKSVYGSRILSWPVSSGSSLYAESVHSSCGNKASYSYGDVPNTIGHVTPIVI